jgi:hypothetical protein
MEWAVVLEGRSDPEGVLVVLAERQRPNTSPPRSARRVNQ